MDESGATPSPTRPEDCIPVIRRHAHDARNGLNGFEIEASLIEALHPDEKTLACIRRMRNQAGSIELALRFLVNRFTEPDLQVVPAVDVFNLWKSRGKRLSHFDSITWTEEVGDALITVDSTIVSEALCEGVSYVRGAEIEASASRVGDEILFEIRPKSGSATLVVVNEWPWIDLLIGKNGGRHEVVAEAGRGMARRCWFPLGRLSVE